MQIVKDGNELQSSLSPFRRKGKKIGLVPTMGALHEGHRSLIEAARLRCDAIVVSTYVNPSQFGPQDDWDAYPRDRASDAIKLKQWGADFGFVPDDPDIYPLGTSACRVLPPEHLILRLCGPFRPGHFSGVLTVVLKLFALVRPDFAFFGQKDIQQWRLINDMAQDLLTGVEVVRCPTIREPDGVARSSRNSYLSPGERLASMALSRTLAAGLDLYRQGERRSKAILEAMEAIWPLLVAENAPGTLRREYLEVLDLQSLAPLSEVGAEAVAAIAVKIGKARLIDNVLLAPDSPDFSLLDRMRGSLYSGFA